MMYVKEYLADMLMLAKQFSIRHFFLIYRTLKQDVYIKRIYTN